MRESKLAFIVGFQRGIIQRMYERLSLKGLDELSVQQFNSDLLYLDNLINQLFYHQNDGVVRMEFDSD